MQEMVNAICVLLILMDRFKRIWWNRGTLADRLRGERDLVFIDVPPQRKKVRVKKHEASDMLNRQRT